MVDMCYSYTVGVLHSVCICYGYVSFVGDIVWVCTMSEDVAMDVRVCDIICGWVWMECMLCMYYSGCVSWYYVVRILGV